jgi:hypothetical protein
MDQSTQVGSGRVDGLMKRKLARRFVRFAGRTVVVDVADVTRHQGSLVEPGRLIHTPPSGSRTEMFPPDVVVIP